MATKSANITQGDGKKTSWLLVVLVVLLLFLVAVIAVGGTWVYMGGGHSGDPAVEQQQTKTLPNPVYVPVKSFTVNLNGARSRVLYVELSLKVPSDEMATRLTEHMPQVRNRILMVLTTQEAEALTTLKGKKALANSIRDAVAQPFNKEADPLDVESVLFTNFIVQ